MFVFAYDTEAGTRTRVAYLDSPTKPDRITVEYLADGMSTEAVTIEFWEWPEYRRVLVERQGFSPVWHGPDLRATLNVDSQTVDVAGWFDAQVPPDDDVEDPRELPERAAEFLSDRGFVLTSDWWPASPGGVDPHELNAVATYTKRYDPAVPVPLAVVLAGMFERAARDLIEVLPGSGGPASVYEVTLDQFRLSEFPFSPGYCEHVVAAASRPYGGSVGVGLRKFATALKFARTGSPASALGKAFDVVEMFSGDLFRPAAPRRQHEPGS